MIKRIKKELKKLQKAAKGQTTIGNHTHTVPGGGHSHTNVAQGHTHSIPGHSHNISSTSMPFYDPSTGLQEEPFEWFHKVFCPCGSIDWIEVSRIWAWSHVRGGNVAKKLVVCKECEKVTIVDDDEIVEQRDPIEAADKFEFFEKLRELRLDFEQSQYPRTTSSTTMTSTTSTTSTTRPPPPPRG